MESMFGLCFKLIAIKGIDKFITNKVTSMNKMFQSCCELEYLDLNYKTKIAIDLMINLFNKRKEEAFKNIKINKRRNKLDANKLRKNKNALQKLKSILKKNCGKYVFSLYKKNK